MKTILSLKKFSLFLVAGVFAICAFSAWNDYSTFTDVAFLDDDDIGIVYEFSDIANQRYVASDDLRDHKPFMPLNDSMYELVEGEWEVIELLDTDGSKISGENINYSLLELSLQGNAVVDVVVPKANENFSSFFVNATINGTDIENIDCLSCIELNSFEAIIAKERGDEEYLQLRIKKKILLKKIEVNESLVEENIVENKNVEELEETYEGPKEYVLFEAKTIRKKKKSAVKRIYEKEGSLEFDLESERVSIDIRVNELSLSGEFKLIHGRLLQSETLLDDKTGEPIVIGTLLKSSKIKRAARNARNSKRVKSKRGLGSSQRIKIISGDLKGLILTFYTPEKFEAEKEKEYERDYEREERAAETRLDMNVRESENQRVKPRKRSKRIKVIDRRNDDNRDDPYND